MIETTARIRLPGPTAMLTVLNFLIALMGVILAVLGMAGVERHVRVETSLISKGPLVGLCIFLVIIDLMYMFTKFHLGKNIDKPLTFFLLVLKYASAIFLTLALIRVFSLKTVILVTEETVCKHSADYGSFFFHAPVSLRHLGLDIYMMGPKGILYGCESMDEAMGGIFMALLGIGFAIFAQINFMLMATFGYRQFKKGDIIVAPKKSSTTQKKSKVKMVTKSDKVHDRETIRRSRNASRRRSRSASRRRSRSASRQRSVESDKSRMARSKRTNHRRNRYTAKPIDFSDSSLEKGSTTRGFSSYKVADVSLDDISLSDIDGLV